jgi:predicted enzyme related to lactoylglutathione lyase
VHVRGRGPGDSFSLPYFAVDDLVAALKRVSANAGAVVNPGEVWAICRDSEGSPFALAQNTGGAADLKGANSRVALQAASR